jgi:hypothetical protein
MTAARWLDYTALHKNVALLSPQVYYDNSVKSMGSSGVCLSQGVEYEFA